MATINQELDFDTAYLVASEFGVTAKKKEVFTKKIYYLTNLKIEKKI